MMGKQLLMGGIAQKEITSLFLSIMLAILRFKEGWHAILMGMWCMCMGEVLLAVLIILLCSGLLPIMQEMGIIMSLISPLAHRMCWLRIVVSGVVVGMILLVMG